jgi:hypothetical protein
MLSKPKVDEWSLNQGMAVYSLKCKICGDEYIGHTSKQVKDRYSQHHRLYRYEYKKYKDVAEKYQIKYKSVFYKHYVETGHEFKDFNVTIIKFNIATKEQREEIEAQNIDERNPKLNRTKGCKSYYKKKYKGENIKRKRLSK